PRARAGRGRSGAAGEGPSPAGAPHPGPHGVIGPPVRPGAARPRGLGLRGRLDAHRGGWPAGPPVPRVRSPGRRGAARRPLRRPRPRGGGRARLLLPLLGEWHGPRAAALVSLRAGTEVDGLRRVAV